jgi:glycosyltransferase involved in cell wall biosynthesis
MKMPLVTIILATYNQESYVANALNSILQQTYKNLEIIICDNGSTDDTKSAIQNILLDNPEITFLNFSENQNITLRHNHCISLASGQFVSILFGDDYYFPTKIEKQVIAFKSLDESWGVVYGPTLIKNQIKDNFFEAPGLQKDGFILPALLRNWHSGGMMNCVVPLTRIECFKKYLNYEDIFTEGEGVFLRVAIDYKFFYLSEPLSVMTEHENNYGKSVVSNIKNHDLVLSRLESGHKLPHKTIALIKSHRSLGLFNASWHCLRTNSNIEAARDLLFSAIKIYPLVLFKIKVIFAIILMLLPLKILSIINRILNTLFKIQPFNIID